MHFYLTWDTEKVPEYGPHVVVMLFGDEFGQMPRYARYVNSVIKTPRGTRPLLGIRRWFPFDAVRRSMLLKYARNMLFHTMSLWREKRAQLAAEPVVTTPHILHTPCGTCMLEDLPIKAMRERPYHCFFAGEVKMEPARGLAALSESPKEIARRSMLKAARALERKEPRFKFDSKVLNKTSFNDGGDQRSYSQRMMDSKICLTPRGTIIDTWRFFEGLKSGCLVLCEPLPDDYFYRDAPVIQIDSWNELEKIVVPLLDNNEELERWSTRSVEFWKNVCGEEAIGRRVAAFISESPASQMLAGARANAD
ncbi:MAG TPA: hypothetical protein VG844_17885 [Terracidiphilus sp.]|nr:hypothetical protein [Terracidiphilus sp.]